MDPKELKALLEGLSTGQKTLSESLAKLAEAQKAQAETVARLDKDFAAKKEADEKAAREAELARLKKEAADALAAKAVAEAELAKLAGASNQGAGDSVSKEMDEAIARARKVAKAYNEMGGK